MTIPIPLIAFIVWLAILLLLLLLCSLAGIGNMYGSEDDSGCFIMGWFGIGVAVFCAWGWLT